MINPYLEIIRKQILTFLSHRGYLNNTQHGFRSGRSCLSTLLDAYNNIMHMINNKSTVDMIYLDFSKAFDKIDHGILLHKLRELGIVGRLGQWFFHFLNRQHYVRKLVASANLNLFRVECPKVLSLALYYLP